MTPYEQDKLLGELLAGDEAEAFRQSSLSNALHSIRRRRARKRVLVVSAITCLPLLVALCVLFRRPPGLSMASRPPLDRQPAPHAVTPAPAAAPLPTLQIINEKQLFALFPNRSIALIGKPGHQEFVFLDDGKANSPTPPKPAPALPSGSERPGN